MWSILHIWALHIPGSSNPTGVEVKSESDTLPFYPYFVAKDGWAIGAFAFLYCLVVFFFPNTLGHPDNYIPANPMSTPAHIVPEWYFWPFYAILRAFTSDFFFVPAKLMGVLAMFSAILVWFFLPWLDSSPVRSGTLPPGVQMFFCHSGGRRAGAGLVRRCARSRALCDDQPAGRDLLLSRTS